MRGELVRTELQMQLRRGTPGFRQDRVDGAQQAFRFAAGQWHALDVELQVLRPGGQDLPVEDCVPRLGGHPPLIEVVRPQRRQDADHHQAHPGAVGGVVGGIQAGPQFAFEPQRLVSGQRPGRDVDLDVVLAEFGLERRIVDVLKHPLVGHRRIDVVVDEVEFEL